MDSTSPTPTIAAAPVPMERIVGSIVVLRGQKVLLDADLAQLYGVETRILVRNVQRHRERFPEDFMFQLTTEEWAALRSQFGISNDGRGGRRYRPYAFTEQGVAMLSSVLNSPRAVQVNIAIMRAFVQLRGLMASHEELARRLDELETRYDDQFRAVFDAIRELMTPSATSTRKLGFVTATEPTR
jgi:hypothetical protein